MTESIQNILTLFVKEVKRVLGEDMDKVIVYGSYARGDYDEHSDIDIMVLTSYPEAPPTLCFCSTPIRNFTTDIPISVNTPATFRFVLEYRWDR